MDTLAVIASMGLTVVMNISLTGKAMEPYLSRTTIPKGDIVWIASRTTSTLAFALSPSSLSCSNGPWAPTGGRQSAR
jgi:hypothetical protein